MQFSLSIVDSCSVRAMNCFLAKPDFKKIHILQSLILVVEGRAGALWDAVLKPRRRM